MSITKTEIAVWSVAGLAVLAIAGVAFLGMSFTTTTMVMPMSPVPGPETAGVAPDATSGLLPEPAGELGAHSVVERSGRALDTSELRGKFVIADFIFTNCGGTCPLMTHKMFDLQTAMKDAPDVVLASFSVDPKRDTPEVLAAFARRYHAGDGWLFLRAEPDVIAAIGHDEVKLWKSRDDPVMHSSQFALIDREGRIRGYYSPLGDETWLAKLTKDLATLRAEPSK